MIPDSDVFDALKYCVVVDRSGTRRYYNAAGQLHREDGPAVENAILKKWYQNGKLHREDGPAITWPGGVRGSWFLHGKEYSQSEHARLVNAQQEKT